MNDPLDAVFGALADPTRRAILARLTEGDAKVAELAAPFHVSQPAISGHLKVLEQAGLISRRRQATARLSHLEAEPLRTASDWLIRYAQYWDERFDQLDELLERMRQVPASPTSTDGSRPSVDQPDEHRRRKGPR
ncbi:MAG TPA: metalloregulator ArsR/SmtB family transcription factor [Candidatus Saccharimonadia bacterium]|nr:metalloregulator ArsR/SmtB family transcription factor [Candidatus Saccharimonadia bacterium]